MRFSDSLKNFSTEVDGEVQQTWGVLYKSIKNYLRYNEKRVKVVLKSPFYFITGLLMVRNTLIP